MTKKAEKIKVKKATRRPKPFTEKQKKLIKLMSENIGQKGSTKTMEKMLLEAGYSETTSHQQVGILNGVQDHLDPIVKRLMTIRELAIDRAQKTMSKAKGSDAITAIDKLTKNIQLLSGRPTERPESTLSEEDRQRLDNILLGNI
jgi:hypothetical protein